MIEKALFYKNMGLIFSGSVLAQIIGIISVVFFTRLYVATDFGIYQMFLSLFSILSVFVTGCYEQAIVIPRYRSAAARILFTIFFIGLFFSILFLILLCLVAFIIPDFGQSDFSTYCFYLPVHSFSVCLYQALYLWFVREKHFSIISQGLVLFSIMNVIFCALFFAFQLGASALVAALVLSRLVVVLYFIMFFIKYFKRYNKIFSWKARHLLFVLQRYKDFPQYMIFSGLLSNFSTELPVFLLNIFWGTSITGYYSLANRFLNIPVSIVSKAVGDVFKQASGEFYLHHGQCKVLYYKNIEFLLKCSAFMGVIIFFIAPDLFAGLLGENWRITGIYARNLLFMFCVNVVAVPLSSIYLIARKQHVYVYLQIGLFIASIFAFCIGRYMFSEVSGSLLILAFVMGIVNVIGIYYGKRIAEGVL